MEQNTIRGLYTRAARDIRVQTRNYWVVTAFIAGHQWLYWDPRTRAPMEQPDDGRIRLTVNRMLTNHVRVMADLTQRKLAFEVRPNGADDASIEHAAMAEKIIHYVADDHNWGGLRKMVSASMKKGGTAAIALDWDDEAKDTVDTALSIADFVVEPGSRDAEKARWWVKAQVYDPEFVRDLYGLKETPRADASAGLNPLQERMMAAHLETDQVNALTLVLTYYERPNKRCPKGRVAVEVGGHIVYDKPWPFPFTDRLNLTVGVDVEIENRWYGHSTYSAAVGPQVGLNHAASNITEHLQDAAQARMLVPQSAVRLMDAMTDVPGNMYPYPDGLDKPAWLQPPQLPGWVQDREQAYAYMVDDLMGVHDVSRGRAPANLESGTAISILAEMDGSPAGAVVRTIAGMFGRHAQKTLQVLEKFGTKTHSGLVDTPAGPLALSWSGKDIGGQHQVFVPEDQVMPRSKAAMQQLANTFVEMGLITSVKDYVQFVEMPGARHIVQVMNPATDKARREHASMAAGAPVLPALFDDHAEHITEHNHFRMTVMYERLSPEAQRRVDLHVQAHETMAAQAAAKMQHRMEASPSLGAVPSANNDPMAVPPGPAGAPPAVPEVEEPEVPPEAGLEALLAGL